MWIFSLFLSFKTVSSGSFIVLFNISSITVHKIQFYKKGKSFVLIKLMLIGLKTQQLKEYQKKILAKSSAAFKDPHHLYQLFL